MLGTFFDSYPFTHPLMPSQVVTVVQLRHRSSLSDPDSSPQASASARASRAAKAEGIEFDQASSVVKFTASDISTCVPAFLEHWERLSKVVVVAGEGEQTDWTCNRAAC